MTKRPRIRATELVRMLDPTGQPVYVLDDQAAVIFCNEACRQWLGMAGEGLLGCRCAYHSSADVGGIEAVAAALCPPPAVWHGHETTASVYRLTETGQPVYRRARFIPLGASAEELLGVVAILGSEDLSEPPAPPEQADAESIPLHELLQRCRQQAVLQYGLERLVGNSPAICRARAQVALAVGSSVSVLVVGPPGSGRQHSATAIHYGAAPESAGTLLPLGCALLGPKLIRSTIDALVSDNRPGQAAARDTLLLHEADQLPPEIQGELALLLSARTFPSRLVATAEQPLTELARHGRYREDLAALLSTITIELPPLTQRREDLPLLAQLFLEEANARGEKQLGGFTPEALDRLDAYSWPGNIDELVQVVRHCHQQAAGPQVRPDDLPERLRLEAETAGRPPRQADAIVLDEFLGRIERELIRRALARSKGNKAKAARLLGLTRPRLYRRMVQLGLET